LGGLPAPQGRTVLAPYTTKSAITKEDELHWRTLHLVPGLGTVKAGKLIAHFRSPQAVFRASRSELESRGLSGSVAQTNASGCTFDDAVEQKQTSTSERN
jgi:DNA processing protein